MNLLDHVMETIDDATAPPEVSKDQAVEFLGDVIVLIQSRMEALREEMLNEKGA